MEANTKKINKWITIMNWIYNPIRSHWKTVANAI